MATVATVYSIEHPVRSAESIIGIEAKDSSPKPGARNKRVWEVGQRAPHKVTEEMRCDATPSGSGPG
jgi:hypothetical protein